MNAERRKKIDKALGMISDARNLLEEISEDERIAVDNMPENLKETDKGERREEIAAMLEESVASLEELENNLEECKE